MTTDRPEDILVEFQYRTGKEGSMKFSIDCEKLDLSGIGIYKINLEQLSEMKKLKTLDLGSNQLEEVDLFPLIGCPDLIEIELDNNPLEILNASPIFLLENLKRIVIDDVSEIYADSLFKYIKKPREGQYPVLRTLWMDYFTQSRKIGWKKVRQRILRGISEMPHEVRFAAQRGILDGLGMEEIAGIDRNITRILESDQSDTIEEACKELYSCFVQEIREQLIQKGSTLFLDIDGMAETEAYSLVPLLLERRRKEMEETVVPVYRNKVDFSALWLTSYGSSILQALNYKRVSATVSTLRQVENTFLDAGFALNISRRTEPGNPSPILENTSESLKNFIFTQFVDKDQPIHIR